MRKHGSKAGRNEEKRCGSGGISEKQRKRTRKIGEGEGKSELERYHVIRLNRQGLVQKERRREGLRCDDKQPCEFVRGYGTLGGPARTGRSRLCQSGKKGAKTRNKKTMSLHKWLMEDIHGRKGQKNT